MGQTSLAYSYSGDESEINEKTDTHERGAKPKESSSLYGDCVEGLKGQPEDIK